MIKNQSASELEQQKNSLKKEKKPTAKSLNENQSAFDGVAAAVAEQILNDIDSYCVEKYNDGHRNHLGASLIGHECSRYLWYVFRWCKAETFDGRILRLFNRGHREEARFIEWLEGIGCKVWFEDRESNPLYYVSESNEYFLKSDLVEDSIYCNLAIPVEKTDALYCSHISSAKAQGIKFPQYRISDVKGHFGGSLDGICILPERYGIAEPVLLEFKTNGTGAGFNKLFKEGLSLAKEQHYAQTSTYGFKYGFKYVLYLNINKNDDSIYCELAKLSPVLASHMIAKAERIIMSEVAPVGISDNATYFRCKFCSMTEICHEGASPEVNCRSCKHASPIENAEWSCALADKGPIPKDVIKVGCSSYKAITENV